MAEEGEQRPVEDIFRGQWDVGFLGQWDVGYVPYATATSFSITLGACRCPLRGRWGIRGKKPATPLGGVLVNDIRGGITHFDDVRPWIENELKGGRLKICLDPTGLDPDTVKDVNDYLCAAAVLRKLGEA